MGTGQWAQEELPGVSYAGWMEPDCALSWRHGDPTACSPIGGGRVILLLIWAGQLDPYRGSLAVAGKCPGLP